MNTKNKVKAKIAVDEDFIYCPRLGNSLEKFVNHNPDGADNKKIAKVLLMEEEEVEELFQSAIAKIRTNLKLKKDNVV